MVTAQTLVIKNMKMYSCKFYKQTLMSIYLKYDSREKLINIALSGCS